MTLQLLPVSMIGAILLSNINSGKYKDFLSLECILIYNSNGSWRKVDNGIHDVRTDYSGKQE